jgi:hypothetical protein
MLANVDNTAVADVVSQGPAAVAQAAVASRLSSRASGAVVSVTDVAHMPELGLLAALRSDKVVALYR